MIYNKQHVSTNLAPYGKLTVTMNTLVVSVRTSSCLPLGVADSNKNHAFLESGIYIYGGTLQYIDIYIHI